jgi:L-ascorbate metabolism protein UlaG (beta-lactamase superfamily)
MITLPFGPFLLAIVLLLFSAITYVAISARRQFGAIPTGLRLTRIESSPQYNKAKKIFENEITSNFRKAIPFWGMVRKLLFGPELRTPTQPLPSVKPDLAAFMAPAIEGKVARALWLGHSTVLFNIDGKLILIDPTLTKRVSPIALFGRRFQAPPLSLEELPPLDFIIVSHDHYDHLDADSIRFFAREENRNSHIITSLGVGARLESFGVHPSRISELDWWEQLERDGFKFTATPSQHFSGRSFNDNAKTLWSGIAIQHQELKVFFSGDSGYHSHFKAIGERLGPFDFAVLESGQYNLWWRFVHMLPEEVVKAAQDIRSTEFMPIHWGMYNLSIHDWFEPIERVSTLAEKNAVAIRTPMLGEIIGFGGDTTQLPKPTSHWWREHVDFIRRSKTF